jgi:hypothetical protein
VLRFPAPPRTPASIAIISATVVRIRPYQASINIRPSTTKFEPVVKITTADGKCTTLSSGPHKSVWIVLDGDIAHETEVKVERFTVQHPQYQTDQLRAHLENNIAAALVQASPAKCKGIYITGSTYFRDAQKPLNALRINEALGKAWHEYAPRGLSSYLYFKGTQDK